MQVQTRMSPLSPPSNQRSGHIRITPEAGEAILIKSAEDVTTHWEKLPQWLTHQLNQQDAKTLPDILNRFAEKDNVILDLHPTDNIELKVPNSKTNQEEQVAFFPWLTDVQKGEKSILRRDSGRALDQIRPAILIALGTEVQKRNYSAYGHTPQVGESIENVLSTPAYQAIYGEPVEKVAPLPVTNVTINPKSSQGVNAVTNPHQLPVAILTPSDSGAEALQSPGVLIKQVIDLFTPLLVKNHDPNSEIYSIDHMPQFWLAVLEKKLGRGEMPQNFQAYLNGYRSQMKSNPNDLEKLYTLLEQCMNTICPKTGQDRDINTTGLPIENLVTPEHALYQKFISPSLKNNGFEEEPLEHTFERMSQKQKRKYQTTRP